MDGKDEMFRALEEVDRQNRQRQYLANQLEDQIEDLEKKLKEAKERNAALAVEADLAEMKVQASEATLDSKKRQKEMQVIRYEELVKELGECQDRLDFLAAEYTKKENWFKAKLEEAHKVNASWLNEYMKDPGFKARMEEKAALDEAKALLEKKSADLEQLSAKMPEVWKDFKEKCVQFAEAMKAYEKEEKIAKGLQDEMEKLASEQTPLKNFSRNRMPMTSGQSTPRRSTFESTWMTAFQKRALPIGSKTRDDLRSSPALKMLETMAYSSRCVPHRQSNHEPVRLNFPDSATFTSRATVQGNEMDTRSFSQDQGAQETPATGSSCSQHLSPTSKSSRGSNEPITSVPCSSRSQLLSPTSKSSRGSNEPITSASCSSRSQLLSPTSKPSRGSNEPITLTQQSDQMQQVPFVYSPVKERDVTQPPMPPAVSQMSTAETETTLNQTITIESQSQNLARINDVDTFRAPLPPPPRQSFLSTPAGALSQSQTDIGFGNVPGEQGSTNGSKVGFQYAPPSPSQACEGLNFNIFGPASGSSSASNESGGFYFGGGGFDDSMATEDNEEETGTAFYFRI